MLEVWLGFLLFDSLLFRVKDAMLFVRCMLVCVCVFVSLEYKYLDGF